PRPRRGRDAARARRAGGMAGRGRWHGDEGGAGARHRAARDLRGRSARQRLEDAPRGARDAGACVAVCIRHAAPAEAAQRAVDGWLRGRPRRPGRAPAASPVAGARAEPRGRFHQPQARRACAARAGRLRRRAAERGVGGQSGARRARRAHLLVLGGSLGARALNLTLPQALALLPPERRPEVLHQCGNRGLAEAREAYAKAGVEAQVVPFIEDMAGSYGWADLAVCRAGALTLAELTAAGLGAVLVPFPHAVDDHQTRNAEALVAAGAAELIQERDLNI